ncbi:hypothetical protein CC1G_01468 [Coprinopsis cinerea okayama7|uniref:Uncharacterized protein n=1 Tax=Coprinopsis cinerea (strain Okayama-7 / 130 / ATCC MYA-4618 / FGSC 9003) TaxID=240176 RepID=A8NYY1_COPC7|nr:hypothetical protein CC1G_01468 [Coprinopsis cinerea okayama7\|eukprot:XP_001837556.2 hypothetical protein CC1G_01468 [Coprinopsis cinerea okayama7\
MMTPSLSGLPSLKSGADKLTWITVPYRRRMELDDDESSADSVPSPSEDRDSEMSLDESLSEDDSNGASGANLNGSHPKEVGLPKGQPIHSPALDENSDARRMDTDSDKENIPLDLYVIQKRIRQRKKRRNPLVLLDSEDE